jgi:hypothetical protein
MEYLNEDRTAPVLGAQTQEVSQKYSVCVPETHM